MESASEKNRIHCSKAAVNLLRQQCPDLALKCRGKIDIKGKGKMETYWVNEGGVIRRSFIAKPTGQSNENGRLETWTEMSCSMSPSEHLSAPFHDDIEAPPAFNESMREEHCPAPSAGLGLGQKVAAMMEKTSQQWLRLNEEVYDDEVSV